MTAPPPHRGPWLRPIAAALSLAALAGACGGDDDAAEAPTVAIALGPYTIEPADLTITAGAVTLVVTNVDSIPHNLVVASKGTRTLAPGESQSLPADIAAGDYRMWCDIPGHADLGQVGTLRAVAAP
jgi:plastocyanin